MMQYSCNTLMLLLSVVFTVMLTWQGQLAMLMPMPLIMDIILILKKYIYMVELFFDYFLYILNKIQIFDFLYILSKIQIIQQNFEHFSKFLVFCMSSSPKVA